MQKTILLASLALGLSACTVTVRSDTGPAPTNAGLTSTRSNYISNFGPGRGEGSTYRVGEQVTFRFSSRSPGYLTLISLDPNGRGNVLIRGAAIPAGTTTFPRAEDRVSYTVAPPYGLQRVRAIFTSVQPSTRLEFQGSYTVDRWNSATNAYLRSYPVNVRDVQETFFYIR